MHILLCTFELDFQCSLSDLMGGFRYQLLLGNSR